MTKIKPEFAIGARLTFKPYERAYGVKVTDIFNESGQIVYQVEGLSARSRTTGQCLVESKLFKAADLGCYFN